MTELVDAHAHLGRHPGIDVGGGTAAELLARMDRVGIAGAVVWHTESWLHDPRAGNRLVLDQIAGAGGSRLLPGWVVLPDACGEIEPAEEFVAAARDAGVVAVRAYPADHGYPLAGPDLAGHLRALAGARLPFFVDAPQTDWESIEAVAARHPDLPVVVSLAGYRSLRRIAGVMSRAGNVFLTLADLSTHCGLEWLVARFGPHRLVFGTGAPLRDPAESVVRLLWSGLDDAQVDQIAATTLRGLLPPIHA